MSPLSRSICDLYVDIVAQEELSRLDILHKYFVVETEDRVTSVPLDKEGRPKIMDLGTGTGIWAFHVVEG